MVIFRKNYESLSTQNEQVMGEYKDLLQSFQATLKADKVRCSDLWPVGSLSLSGGVAGEGRFQDHP